jgi:hypothetical protein
VVCSTTRLRRTRANDSPVDDNYPVSTMWLCQRRSDGNRCLSILLPLYKLRCTPSASRSGLLCVLLLRRPPMSTEAARRPFLLETTSRRLVREGAMVSRRMMLLICLVLLSTLFVACGSAPSAATSTSTAIGPVLTDIKSPEELKTYFNQDTGVPRLILLVSPT